MFDFLKKKQKELANIKEISDFLKKLEKNFLEISHELENLKKENKFSIKKMGLVRFNPFSELGGDQSFSVALLDGENDGVVITSFYTKEVNRVYAKPIEKGKSKYLLSEEEKEAIKQAIKKNNEKRK